MVKKGIILALLCFVATGAKAQIYGGDAAMQMPTTELYNPQMMEMSLRAHAEMAARQSVLFKQYGDQTVEAFNNGQWSNAIYYATHALSLYENPSLRYLRGSAYEKLGSYKAALKDYKVAKKGGISEAVGAYNALKQKMKELKRRK